MKAPPRWVWYAAGAGAVVALGYYAVTRFEGAGGLLGALKRMLGFADAGHVELEPEGRATPATGREITPEDFIVAVVTSPAPGGTVPHSMLSAGYPVEIHVENRGDANWSGVLQLKTRETYGAAVDSSSTDLHVTIAAGTSSTVRTTLETVQYALISGIAVDLDVLIRGKVWDSISFSVDS